MFKKTFIIVSFLFFVISAYASTTVGIEPNPVTIGERYKIYLNSDVVINDEYDIRISVNNGSSTQKLTPESNRQNWYIYGTPSISGTFTIHYKLYKNNNFVGDITSKSFSVINLPKPSLSGGVNIVNITGGFKINSREATGTVDRYEFYRSTSSGSLGSKIHSGSSIYYNDTGLTSGTKYYYRIKACNDSGCDTSNQDHATYTAPNQDPSISNLTTSIDNSEKLTVSFRPYDPEGSSMGADIYLSYPNNTSSFQYSSKKSISNFSGTSTRTVTYTKNELSNLGITYTKQFKVRVNLYDNKSNEDIEKSSTITYNYQDIVIPTATMQSIAPNSGTKGVTQFIFTANLSSSIPSGHKVFLNFNATDGSGWLSQSDLGGHIQMSCGSTSCTKTMTLNGVGARQVRTGVFNKSDILQGNYSTSKSFTVLSSNEVNNPPILSLVSHGSTSKQYKGIDFGTSEGGISLPITNTAKIKFKVEDSDNQGYDLDRIVVDFDCENESTNTEVKTLYIPNGLSGEYTISHDYNKENFTNTDDNNFWKKNLKWCASAYDKSGNKSETSKSKLFTIYDKGDWTTYEEEKAQKKIDDKQVEYDNANTEYVNHKKIYEDTCSNTYSNKYDGVIWKLIEDHYRRIVDGNEVYYDSNGENTFSGTGKINNKHPYKIKVIFGKEHNYPALVEIDYDILRYPLENGKSRHKEARAYNYEHKEYLKSAFIHQIIADNIGKGTCLNISTDPHNAKMFSSSSSVEDLALQIKNNNQKDHGLYPAGYYEIANDIANGTEPKIAKEIIFDTFATLDVDTSVFLMLRENKLTKLYFEFIKEENYLTNYEKEVIWAFYHFIKWNESDNYIFPNKIYYLSIIKTEYEKAFAKNIINLATDIFIDTISLGGVEEAHGYAGTMINQGKKLTDIAKNIKKSKSKTTRILNKTIMGSKLKTVSDAIRKGIQKHKDWADDKIYDKRYGAKHEHEYKIPRPGVTTPKGNERFYRLDAIKFDNKNNQIIIRELKPSNQRAINKGKEQLKTYKTHIEKLIKDKHELFLEYKDYKVIIKEVDTYAY